MKFIFVLLILISSKSFANEQVLVACKQKMAELTKAHDVIASNIANCETTRTPEGGPYQRQSLDCDEQSCRVVSHKDFYVGYSPEHEDANEHGYVTYPFIDLDKELQDLSKNAYAYSVLKSVCKE